MYNQTTPMEHSLKVELATHDIHLFSIISTCISIVMKLKIMLMLAEKIKCVSVIVRITTTAQNSKIQKCAYDENDCEEYHFN